MKTKTKWIAGVLVAVVVVAVGYTLAFGDSSLFTGRLRPGVTLSPRTCERVHDYYLAGHLITKLRGDEEAADELIHRCIDEYPESWVDGDRCEQIAEWSREGILTPNLPLWPLDGTNYAENDLCYEYYPEIMYTSPTEARCDQLLDWWYEGVLSDQFGVRAEEIGACSSTNHDAWFPNIEHCQQIHDWEVEGILTSDHPEVTRPEIYACNGRYPGIMAGVSEPTGVPPSYERCEQLGEWEREGTLTSDHPEARTEASECWDLHRVAFNGGPTTMMCRELNEWQLEGTITAHRSEMPDVTTIASRCYDRYPNQWAHVSASRCCQVRAWSSEGSITTDHPEAREDAGRCSRDYPEFWQAWY